AARASGAAGPRPGGRAGSGAVPSCRAEAPRAKTAVPFPAGKDLAARDGASSLQAAMGLVGARPVFLQAVVERLHADAEHVGGALLVAAAVIERGDDELAVGRR